MILKETLFYSLRGQRDLRSSLASYVVNKQAMQIDRTASSACGARISGASAAVSVGGCQRREDDDWLMVRRPMAEHYPQGTSRNPLHRKSTSRFAVDAVVSEHRLRLRASETLESVLSALRPACPVPAQHRTRGSSVIHGRLTRSVVTGKSLRLSVQSSLRHSPQDCKLLRLPSRTCQRPLVLQTLSLPLGHRDGEHSAQTGTHRSRTRVTRLLTMSLGECGTVYSPGRPDQRPLNVAQS